MFLALGGVLGASLLPAAPAPAPVRSADALTLTVADAARAAEFYSRVLLFERISDLERRTPPGAVVRVVRMRLGDETIELVQGLAAGPAPQPLTIVVNDMEQAYLWLRRHQIKPASAAPRADWDAESGEIRTVRFNDPDGHRIVLVQFPADKGAGRWRRPTDHVFLGIDRSAIQ